MNDDVPGAHTEHPLAPVRRTPRPPGWLKLDEMLRRIDDVAAEPTPRVGATGSSLGVGMTAAELVALGQRLDEQDFAAALAPGGLISVKMDGGPFPDGEGLLDAITAAYARLGALPPPLEPVKLTQHQIDSLPKAEPRPFGAPGADVFGTPIVKVDTVEESTPWQLANPAPVLGDQPPTKHQHIWTTTSPMRCVECRHYLTPWWRRVRNRIRIWRWTR